MEEKAKALAQALLDSSQQKFVTSFGINRGGVPTNKVVVVMAVETTEKGEKTVERLSEAIKAMPGPWGEPCPCCNGTGRAS